MNESSWRDCPNDNIWSARLAFLATGEGFDIVADSSVVDVSYSTVRRSWVERLFSLTPWRRFKMVVVEIPSKVIYREDNRIIAHPEMAEILKGLLK